MAKRRGFSPSAGEPQADVPRWTSGRECWVFRAQTPDELCGYHPRLIGSALHPGEQLHYLLYSPVFDAKDGPFRRGGAPGSHAVGITASALLVSRDPHAEAPRQSITRIALDAVFVEIGCALALGWFVVRFAGPRGPTSCPDLFGGQGMKHFRAGRPRLPLGRPRRARREQGAARLAHRLGGHPHLHPDRSWSRSSRRRSGLWPCCAPLSAGRPRRGGGASGRSAPPPPACWSQPRTVCWGGQRTPHDARRPQLRR